MCVCVCVCVCLCVCVMGLADFHMIKHEGEAGGRLEAPSVPHHIFTSVC